MDKEPINILDGTHEDLMKQLKNALERYGIQDEEDL